MICGVCFVGSLTAGTWLLLCCLPYRVLPLLDLNFFFNHVLDLRMMRFSLPACKYSYSELIVCSVTSFYHIFPCTFLCSWWGVHIQSIFLDFSHRIFFCSNPTIAQRVSTKSLVLLRLIVLVRVPRRWADFACSIRSLFFLPFIILNSIAVMFAVYFGRSL